MLNEYKEYYDYTEKLSVNWEAEKEAKVYSRLQLETVTKKFMGLTRVLTVIARRFLYHDLEDIGKKIILSEKNKAYQIKLSKIALECWASYDDIDLSYIFDDESSRIIESLRVHTPEIFGKNRTGKFMEYVHDLKKHFDDYIANNPTSTQRKVPKSLVEAITKWSNTYFDKQLNKEFYNNEEGLRQKYSNKIVTFDIVIADALHEKELKNKAVYIPVKILNELCKIFEKKYSIMTTDYLYTSAYYFLKFEDNEVEYQMINMKDLSNWREKRTYSRVYKNFLELLASTGNLGEDFVSNQAKKITINGRLLEGYRLEEKEHQFEFPQIDDYILICDDIPSGNIESTIGKLYNKAFRKYKKELI